MNQLVGKKEDGTPFVALVLEPGNLHKLRQGQPIVVHVEDFFPNGIPKKLELAIMHSETPIADARALAKTAEYVADERSAVPPKGPHCVECKSTIETLGAYKSDAPVVLLFCPICGCVLGSIPKL